MRRRKNKLNLNGVIIVNKPKGFSSNKVLQQLKYSFNAQKAGHTGTLDPMATGVLPICFGRATKIAQYLLDSDKEYIATIKLGIETDSGDAEGQIIKENNNIPKLNNDYIEKILENFRGEIQQIPPMFSALKYNGQPLYKLAREGEKVEVKPRTITIYNLECLNFSNDEIKIKVKCSKGTYIRTLAIDIGKLIGCGGHLIQLHRTKSGLFCEDKMYDLEQLKDLELQDKIAKINHVETVFTDKEIYHIQNNDAEEFIKTGKFPQNNLNGIVRIYNKDAFIAIADFDNGELKNKKFFEQGILISEQI